MLKWLLGGIKKDKSDIDSFITPLYEGDRGIHDLHENNAVIRLWIPEPLRLAISQTTLTLSCHDSSYLREFFVVYLYGIHELLTMYSNKTGLYFIPPPKYDESRILFSRASTSEVIPGLGKNIVAVKLRLPSKIKDDLQGLANQRNTPLGRFVRELLVQHFIGHTVWPDLFLAFPEQENIANQWVDEKIDSIHIPTEKIDDKIDAVVYKYY